MTNFKDTDIAQDILRPGQTWRWREERYQTRQDRRLAFKWVNISPKVNAARSLQQANRSPLKQALAVRRQRRPWLWSTRRSPS